MQQLLTELRERGIRLWLHGERLGIDAPKGALTEPLRERLRAAKPELVQLLQRGEQPLDALPALEPDPTSRHEPFPLTDVQQAFWTGRADYVELGGGTHFYIELERSGLALERLEEALRRLVVRHDMLRAVIDPDGRQRILPEVPPYRIATHDLRGRPAPEREAVLVNTRRRLSHNRRPTDTWPLFEVQAARLDDDQLRLFISLDVLLVDASSMFLFFQEWRRFYEDPSWCPAALQLSYRDYAEFERRLPELPSFQRAQAYWTARLDTLPPAPELPLAVQPRQLRQPRFVRRTLTVAPERWLRLKARAQQRGATPSTLLMAAFSEVLRRWSRQRDFTLNVTLYNRFPVHPEVGQLIGDFTTTNLLAVTAEPGDSFEQRLVRLNLQLAQDLEHREYSGMRVLRERMRRLGNVPGAGMPVVFTSMLALDAQQGTMDEMYFFGRYVDGITQTPQIWLDHQMQETEGTLVLIWDAVDGLFPKDMLDDMLAAYGDLLQRLADDASAWTQDGALVNLPAAQQALIAEANSTQRLFPHRLLHEMVAQHYQARAHAPAVITDERTLSYGELGDRALRLSQLLHQRGIGPGCIVAVVMHKGWEQVPAVLGILHAGAAYLPIDPKWPAERRAQLLRRAGVRIALTHAALATGPSWPEGVAPLHLDDPALQDCPATPPAVDVWGHDLAYVLFTSGSTGQPKGVMIEHHSAANTVQDIGERFGVTAADRVLGVSALNFDLSVYDLFGVLGRGAALVLPSAQQLTDAAHWLALMRTHEVSVWNSVPQLLQLLVDHLHDTQQVCNGLRWAILSGDWIPVALPERARAVMPGLRLLASGGPTETSIWCTQYEVGDVPAGWKSIPYGKPLANQSMHVLDALLQPCPTWVTGEICIGGAAVGRGYLGDAAATAERFIIHPRSGERLYRSGDLGRRLPDGNIEFLGRDDHQVKVNGHRIELGEIAHALKGLGGLREAVVVAPPEPRSGRPQLVAYVLPDDAERSAWQARIAGGDLARQLAATLPDYMVPRHAVLLDALPMSANGKVNVQALPSPWQQALREEATPTSGDERRMLQIWQGVLDCGECTPQASFFELGGDSVRAITVVQRVQEGFSLPAHTQQQLLQELFTHPTAAELTAAVRQLQSELAQGSAFATLDPMQASGSGT